ncbi:hypothetical protein CRUP_008825 [Coryphaenoides rupestris]|nr:hypothetical protein CRUP_008825 [Coryphaenoides rupestris]
MLVKVDDKDAGRCAECGRKLKVHKDQQTTTTPLANAKHAAVKGRHKAATTNTTTNDDDDAFRCASCLRANNGRRPHRRVHPDPHSCPDCDKTFITLSHLTVHLASHGKERKFKSAAFPATTVKPHAPSDDPPKELNCGVCCRTFVRSSYIRLYVRLKKGQRPYHCKVCNKTFVKMDTFVNHCDEHLRLKKHDNLVGGQHTLQNQGQD